MFDRIPLGATSGVVAYRHLQAACVAQLLLQLGFSHARATAVGAACIGQDQESACLPIASSSYHGPPIDDGVDCKARRVETVAHADKASVGRHVVNAVWDSLSSSVLRPIVDQYRLGVFAPGAPVVFEVADQLFFLVSTLMMGSPAA